MAAVQMETRHPSSLRPGGGSQGGGMPRISVNIVNGSGDNVLTKETVEVEEAANSLSDLPRMTKSPTSSSEDNEDGWGSHFWVTLVDPETQEAFYACPSTGQVSWDPPVGNFVLPPNDDGEWWELADDSRGGIAYYYHTKTGETVWEKPDTFVIPLSILQHTALGKRLSRSISFRLSQTFDPAVAAAAVKAGLNGPPYPHQEQQPSSKMINRRSLSYTTGMNNNAQIAPSASVSSHRASISTEQQVNIRRSFSSEKARHPRSSQTLRTSTLAPIPASPYTTDAEHSQKGAGSPVPPSPTTSQHRSAMTGGTGAPRSPSSLNGHGAGGKGGGYYRSASTPGSPRRPSLSSSDNHIRPSAPGMKLQPSSSQPPTISRGSKPIAPQSLQAAVELLQEQRQLEHLHAHSSSVSSSSAQSPTTSTAPSNNSRWLHDLHADIGQGFIPPPQHQPPPLPTARKDPQHHHHRQSTSSPPQSPLSPLTTTTPLRKEFLPKVRVAVDAASVMFGQSALQQNCITVPVTPTRSSSSYSHLLHSPSGSDNQHAMPGSPSSPRPRPPVPVGGGWLPRRSGSTPPVGRGLNISTPILNLEATQNMSPIKVRNAGTPILVEPSYRPATPKSGTGGKSSTQYPVLPEDLASEIQQFVESDYAKRYFATHRTGFIFKRRVPVEQMMTWQKAPLTSPLLQLKRPLHKDAVKLFKVIQRIMGDRDRDRPVGVRIHEGNLNSSTTSLGSHSHGHSSVGAVGGVLEEERWLLNEGILHGELRDEIYCQVMKQLSGNQVQESVFRGWQLMCVLLITFPPSKNFEANLRSFLQQYASHTEGRVDIMAKHCIQRLEAISKKGPRGKAPPTSEIETASDAAFNPSTFGEPLDAVFRLQERTYPDLKVPIILPFLADGILGLGGTRAEGIFRVPGDGDGVSELKLRIDKGHYNLGGIEDPHTLASLLKLWLRELREPLIPDEMYNACIEVARDPSACVDIVRRLPTYNRRVVLFVISFLQLFLEEKVLAFTKMTSPNLALVMSPNLLRCNSESMTVVFTNAQYEQTFVHNLLVHLKCNEIDPDYVPTHGLGPAPPGTPGTPRMSKSRNRR